MRCGRTRSWSPGPAPTTPVLASALRRLGVTAPVVAELAEHAEGVEQKGGGRPVGTVRALW